MKQYYLLIFAVLYFPLALISQVTTVIDDFNDEEGGRLFLYNDILFYNLETSIFYFNVNDANPAPTLLLDNLNQPNGMELKDNFLYVAHFGEGDLIKIDLNDPNPSIIDVTFYGETPNMLKLIGNDLYYTDTNGNRIYKYNITSGSTSAENFLNTSPIPIGLEIKDNFLYYGLAAQGVILKIGLDNPQGASTQVITGLDRPLGMEFKGNDLYIADKDDDKIVKVDVTETPPVIQDVVTNLNKPKDITFDGSIMYIIENNRLSKIDISLGVSDFSLLDIKFYPNPAKDYLRVSNLTSSYDYYISDINGKIMLEGKFSPNHNSVDVSSFAAGKYFITIKGEISTTEKFLKE
jgi:hypothetical protein